MKTATVLVEGCVPFEDVAIRGAPAGAPVSAPAAAIAAQDAGVEGLAVEVTRIAHAPGGFLEVTVRYRNAGAETFRFPGAAEPKNASPART